MEGGTLLLDEIGDLLPVLQVKWLRFLENGTFERMDGRQTHTVDACVIAVANIDLKAVIKMNQFREDLYYRLGGMDIYQPPLRVRGEDTTLMAMAVLDKQNYRLV